LCWSLETIESEERLKDCIRRRVFGYTSITQATLAQDHKHAAVALDKFREGLQTTGSVDGSLDEYLRCLGNRSRPTMLAVSWSHLKRGSETRHDRPIGRATWCIVVPGAGGSRI